MQNVRVHNKTAHAPQSATALAIRVPYKRMVLKEIDTAEVSQHMQLRYPFIRSVFSKQTKSTPKGNQNKMQK